MLFTPIPYEIGIGIAVGKLDPITKKLFSNESVVSLNLVYKNLNGCFF